MEAGKEAVYAMEAQTTVAEKVEISYRVGSFLKFEDDFDRLPKAAAEENAE